MTARIVSLLLVALAAPAAAQEPDPAPAQATAAPVIPTAAANIALGSRVGELISGYDSGGRRDPFDGLVTPRRASASPAPGTKPPAGLAGVALADVIVRGIVRNGDTMLAILEAPNRQSFVTRVNDRLLDATVVRIDADGVVFGEQVARGMAPNHQRKALRPSGELIQ
jgi:hypothetical protein